MKIIEPYVWIINAPNYGEICKLIEEAGRTCYKSEDKMTVYSAEKFIRNLIKNGHEAMLEHASVTAKFVCDRGVSHELVRHRIASFAQESTRYCNYSKDNFGSELAFIKPLFFKEDSNNYNLWKEIMSETECAYLSMLKNCATPQEARSVLPNSLKTEIAVTMNMREWRHFFKLRAIGTTGAPHPQMKQVATMALKQFKKLWPVFFEDLEVK